ncbi:hypothetical protein ISG25_19520 [Burkholderia pseudomallei]|nr:hypothetical protein [Burkholderia pseudomallei]MBF3848644.1 hypothetical protein [Burkholderia pseudomallei]
MALEKRAHDRLVFDATPYPLDVHVAAPPPLPPIDSRMPQPNTASAHTFAMSRPPYVHLVLLVMSSVALPTLSPAQVPTFHLFVRFCAATFELSAAQQQNFKYSKLFIKIINFILFIE